MILKQWICIIFIFFSCQLHGYEEKTHSSFVELEFLYWQLRETGAENWGQVFSPTTSVNQPVTLLYVPFHWNPGFRIGYGRNDLPSKWDTAIYYTWFQTSGLNQAYA